MAKRMYTEEYIQDIANAIREINGKTDTYKVSEMADEIRASGGVKKTFLYSFTQAQGGAWLNTGIDITNIDVIMFESVIDGNINMQTLLEPKDIAVYTGGTDVYTTIYEQYWGNKQMNARIYNNILYTSYGTTGPADRLTNIYQLTSDKYL